MTSRTFLIVFLGVVLVMPVRGQKRSSAPASVPAAAVAATTTAKPVVTLPLSAQSKNSAAQIASTAHSAGAVLGPSKRGASLQLRVSVHRLPPRAAGHETYDERKKNVTRTDYDWMQLRAIGDHFWLIGKDQLTVSAPRDPSSWSAVRWHELGVQLVDVVERDRRAWLLSSEWLAEVSPDGSRLLSVPHLAPRYLSARRNLDLLSGASLKRSEPINFDAVAVWGTQVWLRNREGAFFTYDQELAAVPLAPLGGNFSLHAGPGGLVAFGTAINAQDPVVLHTTDGRKWTARPGLAELARGDEGHVALGRGRFVRADFSGLSVSADGVVWRRLPEPLLPDATIEVKQKDGTYAQETRPVRWTSVVHAGDFFLVLGEAFSPSGRHETSYPQADVAVAAVSDDGCAWQTLRLPVAPAQLGEWLAAGRDGTFVCTPRYASKEVIVLRLVSDSAPTERHPSTRNLTDLRADAEAAVARRDAPQAARALAELERYFPSEETARVSAVLRAQSGDFDGAWAALVELERVAPDDVLVALTRSQVLQAAGRIAEAQAYARWFLAQRRPAPTGDAQTVLSVKLARCNLMVGAGQIDEALRFAEGEVLRDKSNIEFRLLLAGLHMQRGDKVQAKRWVTEAAALGDARAKQMLTMLP